MYYRFPDEYFFPVESKNDFDFEEIGYRHVIVEAVDRKHQLILNNTEVVNEVLEKEVDEVTHRDTVSFGDYLIVDENKIEDSTIEGARSMTSFDENLVGEFEGKIIEGNEEVEDIEDRVSDDTENQIDEVDENMEESEIENNIDKNLTREESSIKEDEMIGESDVEYVDAEIVKERNEEDDKAESEEIETINE